MSEEMLKELKKLLTDIEIINVIKMNANTFDYLIAKITDEITYHINGLSTYYEIRIEVDNSLKDGEIKYE